MKPWRAAIQGGDPEAFPNTAREPSERTETQRFVWKGDHYVAEKARWGDAQSAAVEGKRLATASRRASAQS